MKNIRPDKDIKPLSEFRANLGRLLEQVRESKRPLVLTKRGHSAAVVLDVEEYEELLEELEVLREIAQATRQLEEGEGVSQEDAREKLLSELSD